MKNYELIRSVPYYGNLSKYLFNDTLKSAFIIWLLRRKSIKDLTFSTVQQALQVFLTTEMVSKMLPKEERWNSYVNGIEIYTADGIDSEFAKSIADSIVNNTDLGYSTNKMHKRDDGVYTHNFAQSEINSSLTEYDEKGYVPYSVSTKSNYYYMIRETGGYMTGAYIDESNPDKVGINPYYNSNVGNESYLLELGYLSNSSDLEILLNERKKIVNAIGESIVNELGK